MEKTQEFRAGFDNMLGMVRDLSCFCLGSRFCCGQRLPGSKGLVICQGVSEKLEK